MNNTTENEVTIDLRDELLERILINLYHCGIEDCSALKPFLAATINDYEVSNRNTELQTLYDANYKIIDTFLAIKRLEGGSEATYDNRKYVYGMFCSFINKPLHQTTTVDVLAWIAFLEKTRKLSTCNSYRSALSSLLTWMTEQGYFKKNPMKGVRTIKHDESIENGFDPVELDAIRSKCKKPIHRAVVELLYSSGIRCAELVELQWSDINFITNEIIIREGKGGKSRFTMMNDVCKKYLLEYRQNMKYESEYVFPSRYRKVVGKRTTNSIWLMLKNIGIDAEVEHVHPHRLRKCFATELENRGTNLSTIQRFLGHSNLACTQRYLSRNNGRMITEYKKAFG